MGGTYLDVALVWLELVGEGDSVRALGVHPSPLPSSSWELARPRGEGRVCGAALRAWQGAGWNAVHQGARVGEERRRVHACHKRGQDRRCRRYVLRSGPLRVPSRGLTGRNFVACVRSAMLVALAYLVRPLRYADDGDGRWQPEFRDPLFQQAAAGRAAIGAIEDNISAPAG